MDVALYTHLHPLCALAWTILVDRHVGLLRMSQIHRGASHSLGLEEQGRSSGETVELVGQGWGHVRGLLTGCVKGVGVGCRGRVGEGGRGRGRIMIRVAHGRCRCPR